MRRVIVLSLVLLVLLLGNIAVFKASVLQPNQVSIGGWLPYWDQKDVMSSFKKNKSLLNEVSPYWYVAKPDGKVTPVTKLNIAVVAEAKASGIKVMPMVSNGYNGAMISKIINNTKLRMAHIRELVNKVVKRKVDGIELDYEGLLPKDRKMYARFIKVLSEALHRRGKLLSVTLQSKTKEPGTSQGSKAQDWREIGKYADRLRIMAYDFHWKTSGPGPIAPVWWVEQIAKLAKKTIPPNKAILAFGTYGYNWYGNGRAKAISLAEARALAKKYKTKIQRDPKSKELYLRIKPGKAQIWIQDSGSLRLKLRVLKKYGLGGTFLWRLGDEDPATWQVLQQELR